MENDRKVERKEERNKKKEKIFAVMFSCQGQYN